MLRYLPLLAVLALGMPAHAEECIPSTSSPEVAVFGFYIDIDHDAANCSVQVNPNGDIDPFHGDPNEPYIVESHCPFDIVTYQESNSIEGLQRGDWNRDDTCGGQIEADTYAFY